MVKYRFKNVDDIINYNGCRYILILPWVWTQSVWRMSY